MWMAVVDLSFESIPPIVNSRPSMNTQVGCVTGGAASLFHKPAVTVALDLQHWMRALSEHVYISLSIELYVWLCMYVPTVYITTLGLYNGTCPMTVNLQ